MANTTLSTNASQFVVSALKELHSFRDIVKIHLRAVNDQRTLHPRGKAYIINEDALGILHAKCDTLRESGESADFKVFTSAVDQLEKLLGKLRTPIQYRRTDILADILTVLEHLEQKMV